MHVLLISHSMDFSGAPVALLALSRSLRRLGHSITVAGILAGPITEVFVREGCALFRPQRNRPEEFDVIFANTVLSVPAALAFARGPERVIAWIHEPRDIFEMLGRPLPQGIHSMHLDKLRWAAFAADFQLNEYAQVMPGATRVQLRNCIDLGFAVPDDAATEPYYVCTGRWEARKSQTRLVNLLRSLGDTQRIHFVGAERQLSVSEPQFSFLGSLPPDQAKRQVALSRGIITCSRAETQSLVPIEAAMACRPALLSDIPAHRELQTLMPSLILFDPDDIRSFSRGLAEMRAQWEDAAGRERARALAIEYFGVATFDRNVSDLITRVAADS